MSVSIARISLLIAVSAVPASAIVVAGTDPYATQYSAASYSGVVRVYVGSSGVCSGSLFGPSNIYVLTAAHCVTDSGGNGITNLSGYSVAFDTASVTALNDPISAVYIAPGYLGAGPLGTYANDLAVVQLQDAAPADAASYSVLTNNASDIGREVVLVGQGASGTGTTGITISPSTDRRNRRMGLNDYDVYGFNNDSTHVLWDFDNGTDTNNALAYAGFTSSTGRGTDEVTIAGGDSGGPSFDYTTGQIVGVHSYTSCFTSNSSSNSCVSPPDYMATTNGPGGYFGELGADTRVDLYGDFLSPFTASATPEPGTWILMASAGLACIGYQRLRRLHFPQ